MSDHWRDKEQQIYSWCYNVWSLKGQGITHIKLML